MSIDRVTDQHADRSELYASGFWGITIDSHKEGQSFRPEQAVGLVGNDTLHYSVPDIAVRLDRDSIAVAPTIARGINHRINNIFRKPIPGGYEYEVGESTDSIVLLLTPDSDSFQLSPVNITQRLSFADADLLMQGGDETLVEIVEIIRLRSNFKKETLSANEVTGYLSITANTLAAAEFSLLDIPGIYTVQQDAYDKHYSETPVASSYYGVPAYMQWTRPGADVIATINNLQYAHYAKTGQVLFERKKVAGFVADLNAAIGMK